ncbi:hypothetical protein P873_11120 [Arenimonas composti TR7-09 = DSM 18010]|uniref:diguanylate cyclase n=2 Tax=Arenimonas TaxID=490567 RepID=A0A091BCR0_9GAMM|nr:GGDEF domain-containing protein [Arenimonas composti]KFN49317.1 hypothetical protein P873_11120 [Arenimonas composti TR7-09 = DSM 18010]
MSSGTADGVPSGSTARQRAEDLHERALIGGVFYLLSWLLVAGYGGAWDRHPRLSGTICGLLVVLGVARLLVRRWYLADPARAVTSMRIQWAVLLVTAALWGAVSAWALWDRGFAPAYTLTLLATCALAMAFAQIFAIARRLALVGTAMIFLPMLAIVLARLADPGIAIVLVLNLAYMVAVIGRGNREYEGRLALDVELREQRDRFAAASRTDALTGLANRRHFQQGLEDRIAAARADGSELALAFLIADLDHFKSINDRFGHAAGDRCLREVAALLRESFGEAGDAGAAAPLGADADGERVLVARLGGEEFGVLVSGVAAAGIAARAEAFRERLQHAPIELPDGTRFEVTVSVGLARFAPGRHRDGDALYAAADEALYRAKNGGRNRIEAA